jgi:hypothetical protein
MLGICVGPGVGDGDALGVGEGIGIVCRCCACAEATNNKANDEVSTVRVSGWVKDLARNCWNMIV